MKNKELTVLLEQFTKPELLAMFADSGIKATDKKDILIENITKAGVSDEKINALERVLSDRAKAVKELNKRPDYVVVHPIKEGKELLVRGDEYKGKFAAKFLKEGQIKAG